MRHRLKGIKWNRNRGNRHGGERAGSLHKLWSKRAEGDPRLWGSRDSRDRPGESIEWVGGVGWGWGISFLRGADLQSGSGTGAPFNQTYSNCIGWPLWIGFTRRRQAAAGITGLWGLLWWVGSALWTGGNVGQFRNFINKNIMHRHKPSIMVKNPAQPSCQLKTDSVFFSLKLR